MKILCTEKEQAYILSHAAEEGGLCPALMHHTLCDRGSCSACLMDSIDWEIENDNN